MTNSPTMTPKPTGDHPSGAAETRRPTGPASHPTTRRGTALRLLIAAVATSVCATAATLPYLIPGVERWAIEAGDGNPALLLVVETLRFPLAALAALGLLVIAAKIEKVRLRDYFGNLRAPQAWGILGATTLTAAAVTALAAGVLHLTGLDAGRAAADVAGIPLLLVVVYGLARAFLLQAIQEEWWFRGFAFRGYQHRPWFVLITTTVAFTLIHLSSSGGQQSLTERLLYLVLPLGMALWAGVERWCTGSVWGAVGIHGGIHTGLLVPAVLGWGFGPAAWVGVGVALSAAATVRLLLRRPWRTT
ncbi:lysostaphin resistance A-like protein [Enemella sp. A6]|uniref:CPBP family intramembrane glutamic endopeptidase n=1 Tax=Enemella sp. A6 TaxID=3440152 RepID=UPI003EB8756B